MKIIVGCLVVVQTIVILFLANLYLPADRLNPFVPQTESQKKYYERYEKSVSLDTVITEIQRASFCQNVVIPMTDEWSENKGKQNASLKDKLGPNLWDYCGNYVWAPVALPKKSK